MLVAAENRPWKYQADVSSLMVLTSKFCSLIYLCLYECDHKYDKNVVSIGSIQNGILSWRQVCSA